MNTFYEFSYFLKLAAENKLEDETEKIKSEIKKNKGVIIEETPPLKKFLSYPILKHKEGLFGLIKFLTEPETINILNLNFKKNTDILRFFIKKESYKKRTSVYRKRTPLVKKEKIQKQTKEQISEIDKKLEEILGI